VKLGDDPIGPPDIIFLMIFMAFSLFAESLVRTVTIADVAFSLALGVAVNLVRRAGGTTR